MTKILLLLSLVLISSVAFVQSSFAWDGKIALDSNNRNIEYGDVINYEGYLYGADLIEEELVYVILSEQTTEVIIWEASIAPSLSTVEYFENTAWTFDFRIDTSETNIAKGNTYVVEAIYDDKTTKLDFFIKPDQLEEKVSDAGEAIVVAGEKTNEVIVETGEKSRRSNWGERI